MKENWFVILIFSLIFGILGFLLGKTTGHHSCHNHHAQCCSPDHGAQKMKHKKKGKRGNHWKEKDDEVEMIIGKFENSDFEGDTALVIDGGTIQISKSNGEIQVEIEMEEGQGKIIKKETIIKEE